ncbi:MAG: helix-turn-helix domain-containing protein [Frankia sp.]
MSTGASTSSEAGPPQAALGAAIRVRRLARGLTLKDVAALTGLSHPFLSKIERGLAQPSMRSLTMLADALGTTAHTLMALDEPSSVGLLRHNATSVAVEHAGGVARALVRGRWPFLPVEFRSGPREFEEYYLHEGGEMTYVAEGSCEMDVEGHGVYRLGPGDSLFYGGGIRHRWRQVSDGPIRMLLIQENVERLGGPVSADTRSPEFVRK